MNIYTKILAFLLLFTGELLGVYAIMIAARSASVNDAFIVLIKSFLLAMVGGVILVGGYYLGYKAFQNIWIVMVISITSILILEPALAYILFHELPTRGAAVGLILGALGLIATVTL